jgi:hypothetical protein
MVGRISQFGCKTTGQAVIVEQGKDQILKFMDQTTGMKGWKSYLLWEGLPFLMLLSIFGSISAVNWDYERKFITPDNGAPDWTGVHLGMLMLAIAMGQALYASSLLFVVRITQPRSNSGWYMLVSLTVVSIFLIFPSLFIIILGPAGITMTEQMREVSR